MTDYADLEKRLRAHVEQNAAYEGRTYSMDHPDVMIAEAADAIATLTREKRQAIILSFMDGRPSRL